MPTLDMQNPPNGLPRQQFCILVLKVCYLKNKTKELNQFSLLNFFFLGYLLFFVFFFKKKQTYTKM